MSMTTKLLYIDEKDSWVIYTDDLEELKKHLEKIIESKMDDKTEAAIHGR